MDKFSGQVNISLGGPIEAGLKEHDLLFDSTPQERDAEWTRRHGVDKTKWPDQPPTTYVEQREQSGDKPLAAAFTDIQKAMKKLALECAKASPSGQVYGYASFTSTLKPAPKED